MDYYYSELKWKNEILSVAEELGYKGEKSGSFWLGNCPDNENPHEKCLTIRPNTQRFYCSHCQKGGDVIDLTMLFKKVDYKRAMFYLTERVEIPYLGYKNLTNFEVATLEAEYRENALVDNMLTHAAAWYHSQLDNYRDIKEHLINHYKFSENIIREFQIGFAPPPTSDTSSQLAEYLNSFPEFQGKLPLTGLFNFESQEGPCSDFFIGRIIFPYWKSGKVVYMAGRATKFTPVTQSECCTNSDGNVKRDDQGRPDYIKYKKLPTYDSYDPQKEHISIFIQDDTFLGEDITRDGDTKEILITRSASDFISAIDHGFSAISPATNKFYEKDFDKLKALTAKAYLVYVINDNEGEEVGFDQSKMLGTFLTKAGRSVFPIELRKEEGEEEGDKRIDLNEYLRDNPKDNLCQLIEQSGCIFEGIISELPGHPLRALPSVHSDIAPILAEHRGAFLNYYHGFVVRQTNLSVGAVSSEIRVAKEQKILNELRHRKINIDPEIKKLVVELLLDPAMYKRRIDAVNRTGVVGERKAIAMYFAALDSRLLSEEKVLAVKNSGHFGAGKSFTLDKCLRIYPETAYYYITSGSTKSLYYLGKDCLRHKTLIIAEGFQLQTNKKDSELLYVIRSLISEGRVRYKVAEMVAGGRKTNEKKLDGPTSVITTTIVGKLEDQLEDRLFTVHPDESVEQTKEIIIMCGKERAGKVEGLDRKTIEMWQVFHDSLKPVQVIIPYAEKISHFVNQRKNLPLSSRRAFKRVMSVVETVACFHQHQRERDNQNRVVAEYSDYWMAIQIIREAFVESTELQGNENIERFKEIEKYGVIKSKELAKQMKVSAQAISKWTTKGIERGIIAWCDANGNEFQTEDESDYAKSTGSAYLRVVKDYIVGLPTPYDLTGDPKWKKGAELYEQYYLNLHTRNIFYGEVDGEEVDDESNGGDNESAQTPELTQREDNSDDSNFIKVDQLKVKKVHN